jgi:hypothetical protein
MASTGAPAGPTPAAAAAPAQAAPTSPTAIPPSSPQGAAQAAPAPAAPSAPAQPAAAPAVTPTAPAPDTAPGGAGGAESPGEKKEIYAYEAPWLIYGMNWSVRPDKRFRLAIGSFVEEYTNKVRALLAPASRAAAAPPTAIERCSRRACGHTQVEVVQLNEDTGKFVSRGRVDHPYPTTKIMWIPDKTGQFEDLMATTGDYLRLWQVTDEGITQKCVLNNVRAAARAATPPC